MQPDTVGGGAEYARPRNATSARLRAHTVLVNAVTWRLFDERTQVSGLLMLKDGCMGGELGAKRFARTANL